MPQNAASQPKTEANGGSSREEKQSRRQAEILEKAIELFARYGYADTDTQLLADELCVGKGTIYRYFASKQELFLAAVEWGLRKLQDRMEPHLASDLDPLEKIRLGIRTYIDFFLEHSEIVELLIQERALFKDRRKPTYYKHRERNIKRWQALYSQLMEEGRIRRMPPERITDIVGDLIWGTMFTNYFSGRSTSAELQAEAILDIVCFGILVGEQRCAWQAQSDQVPGDQTSELASAIKPVSPDNVSDNGNGSNSNGENKARRNIKIRKP